MVCELCNITTLHITFIPNLFCKYGKNLLPLQDKRKQQPKHTSPLIYNIMIIKHLQGGGATDFCFLRQCNVWRVSPFSSPFQ